MWMVFFYVMNGDRETVVDGGNVVSHGAGVKIAGDVLRSGYLGAQWAEVRKERPLIEEVDECCIS